MPKDVPDNADHVIRYMSGRINSRMQEKNETFRAIKRIEAFLSECSFPILLFTARPGGIIRQERIA
ncbi:MAG: hypothetical protein JSV13_04960 [Nitrospiraceae bacterium]|nr:MAG: hypothetical protein JSV13_04960 [Nitrospiraceae bacterium]